MKTLVNSMTKAITIAMGLLAVACSSSDEPQPVDCAVSDLAITLSSKSNPTDCNTNNGSITVTATGGTAPYQFKINTGTFGSPATFTNLGSGSYDVVVKDANNCERTLTAVTINAPSAPVTSPSTLAHQTDCLTPNGSITVNVTSGSAPYQYKIGTAAFASSNVFANLKAGVYSITVKDNVNCTTTITETILSSTTVSYSGDIFPILQTNCIKSGCHNGDNGADRNWSTFSNVKANAQGIKTRTGNRSMPKDNPSALTQAQIDMIACWVDSGAMDN